ncbi:DUF3025 domain-containing protein [Noviherbaspirillum aridicola]|uniref:DUF3025 family protein n=1 Tax=Noviherbaspirillum aridicola TaxID=2849687 RepID=A0ABQ4Q7X9_9BURK|nr:DUF3025 domain-containing protein [Noviherbaspirillum aridicola]GIZ52885.1 hypothetical protein NCCP691_28990 [Noviherbaspirillum aridicola]
MTPEFLQSLDWHRPWLVPYRELGQALATSPNWRGAACDLARGIRNSRGHTIRFVPQSALPAGVAYEAFIAETGCVPTRENLHDFFNALVWLTFPRIKVQLNARQAAEIEATGGVTGVRGRVRDAATLFDENAALLVTRDLSLLSALREHAWTDVFLNNRTRFMADCEVILFGHALMEKLVTPYKAITAHAWPLLLNGEQARVSRVDYMKAIDERIAQSLYGMLSPASFTPLPIMGIPSWSEGQDTLFYADKHVFRPKRPR